MTRARSIFQLVTARVRRTLQTRNLLPKSYRLLLAVSGGQDSLTLLKTIQHLHRHDKPWLGIHVAHCDHHWPHDVGLSDHVQSYCSLQNLPFTLLDASTGPYAAKSPPLTEAAAREWRYDALSKCAHHLNCSAVVTAHTRTDLTETLLFNLSHGAGADGLTAMTWKRNLNSDILLVRPLLDVSRDETFQVCQEQSLPVWVDVYNSDESFARNRIRKFVVPALKSYINQKADSAIARTAHLLRDDVEFLENEATKVYDIAIHIESQTEQCNGVCVHIDRKILHQIPLAIRRRVIRRVVRDIVVAGLNGAKVYDQVENVCKLLNENVPVGTSIPSLSRQATAVVENEQWLVIRIPEASSRREQVETPTTDSSEGIKRNDSESRLSKPCCLTNSQSIAQQVGDPLVHECLKQKAVNASPG